LSYQPSTNVWHVHGSDDAALRKVLFGYGKGLSATAFSEVLKPGRIDMIRGTLWDPRDLAHDRQSEIEYGMPWKCLVLEVAGILYGPLAYARKRWQG
jgi:hypothetical protein